MLADVPSMGAATHLDNCDDLATCLDLNVTKRRMPSVRNEANKW